MFIYSPIEKIEFQVPNGYELFIKRDDRIHPFISGNKWRKLKYLLAKATAEKKTKLVTFGGAYSNHLLATACAGASFGFQTVGIVRGEENAQLNPVLFLCKQFGMEIIYIDRTTYLEKEKYYNSHYQNDSSAFFIDEGGKSKEAIKGCAELMVELDQNYDHILLATGTGSTLCGIIEGVKQHPIFISHVHSIIIHKEFEEIKNYCEEETDSSNYTIHPNYHLGGYAKTNKELIAFMQNFHQHTGILLDPVYTGKMMMATYDLMQQNYFAPNSKILVIHTGGLMGILGMQEKFQ